MHRLFAAAALLFLAPAALLAQAASGDWRTVESPHFRVHYPRDYEAWALRAASRLESIHGAVSKEVGFTPPQVIDVLVMNPVAEPNGIAWPFLDTPRIIFFTEPPGPDEQLGAYGAWIDLLAVHEVAHVVHMLRPARNPLERLLGKTILPLNPITVAAPRWVLEGYATVVEGRLTGAGRPSSTIRALILRRWAENGRLPTYSQLDSDQRFLGMSMAYLMGSAFLEWLEERGGEESLRNLWLRLTARQRRSFDEAFVGVYGDRPDRLYGQFMAELTASAVTVKRGRTLHEGTLFQETPRASGSPAVSPDGSQLAVVIRPRNQPERLTVWSTGAPEEEEKKYRERIEKILARDPEDVAPVRSRPLPRKAKHTFTMPDGGDIQSPRWTRDGKALLFSHRTPDADGVLHFDLYRWDFERLTRITHLADVRDADPIDERRAIAVRSRFGLTELVEVDLGSGAVTPRGEASLDVVYANPRASADGRLAHVAHRNGRWTLFVVDDKAAELPDAKPVELPGDAATPAWLPNGDLLVTVFARGFAELYRVDATGTATPVTNTAGGAFEPAPASDGRLFFMSLEPDGYVVRVLDAIEPVTAPAPLDASFIPAIPPLPRTATAFDAGPVSTPRPYGFGRQEFSWFTGTNYAPDQQSYELGIRMGDLLGRLDALLIGALGRDDTPGGVALAAAWRGWPIEAHGHVYNADDDSGVELRGLWSRRFPQSRLTVEAGALSGGERDDLLFGSAAFSTVQHFGATRLEETLRVEIDDDHYRGVIGAGYRAGSLRIAASYQHDGGAPVTLGGLPSSILPRSAYATRVLDPALPVAILRGDEYDGWRIETTLGIPLTLFYQRHELGSAQLSLAGAEIEFHSGPDPILKVPGLDLTLGAAYVFDEPLRGDTKWWLGMRWRP